MTAGQAYKAVVSIALCGLIWVLGERAYREYREMQSDPTVVGVAPAAPVDSLPPLEKVAVTLPALDELTATIERPMFSPSRRSLEVAAETVETASTVEVEFDLVGIVIWQGQRIALVRSDADPQIVRIEVGGNVAGWVAVGIEPDSVRFRNGKMEKEVHLKYAERDNNG